MTSMIKLLAALGLLLSVPVFAQQEEAPPPEAAAPPESAEAPPPEKAPEEAPPDDVPGDANTYTADEMGGTVVELPSTEKKTAAAPARAGAPKRKSKKAKPGAKLAKGKKPAKAEPAAKKEAKPAAPEISPVPLTPVLPSNP